MTPGIPNKAQISIANFIQSVLVAKCKWLCSMNTWARARHQVRKNNTKLQFESLIGRRICKCGTRSASRRKSAGLICGCRNKNSVVNCFELRRQMERGRAIIHTHLAVRSLVRNNKLLFHMKYLYDRGKCMQIFRRTP